jgi:hypothetical protein
MCVLFLRFIYFINDLKNYLSLFYFKFVSVFFLLLGLVLACVLRFLVMFFRTFIRFFISVLMQTKLFLSPSRDDHSCLCLGCSHVIFLLPVVLMFLVPLTSYLLIQVLTQFVIYLLVVEYSFDKTFEYIDEMYSRWTFVSINFDSEIF